MTVTGVPQVAAPPAPPARSARDSGQLGRLLPMLPAVLLLALFFAGPILWCFYSAFTNAALTGAAASNAQFVGLANFRQLFADPQTAQAIWLTVVFVLGSAVFGQNLLGLVLALLMKGRNRFVRSIVGLIVISAWVLPEIVGAFVWYAFLNPEGTLNAILGAVHLPHQNWIYTVPIFAVILANVWRGTAFSMLVYSAALSDVPPELSEAAAIDGASGWKQLWYVTLPLIRRAIATNLMLITLQTLAVFTLIFVMTGGGPGTKSQTLPLLMYQQAFKFSQIGLGTAIALILLCVGGLFSIFYIRMLRPEV
jgi:multiple sugar transport system permease protein